MNHSVPYRGRIAPTPTGFLHLGHARTFWIAWERCRARAGTLVFRNEDLDRERCKPEFAAAMTEDLRWFGLSWDEGPDVGGPFSPYHQSQRLNWYLDVWKQLKAAGVIYPSPHSRRDVEQALVAPHDDGSEPLFPVALRPPVEAGQDAIEPGPTNWRFRVPDGETIRFIDGRSGLTERTAGSDFGDFLVWRKDGLPAYELAVVADDHAMGITEAVRGEDLLTSTARQLLVYRALGWLSPEFFHCPLMRDERGQRLAKRTNALALRTCRQQGLTPEDLRNRPEWQTA